jgi:glycolate oxidase
VVIVTNGMKSILEINEADMYAVVQPGVVTAKLAAAVEAKGFSTRPIPAARRSPPSAEMWPKTPAACAG